MSSDTPAGRVSCRGMTMMKWMAPVIAIATGCAASTAPQGGPSDDTAHVEVKITDAPGAFDSVFVTISKSEISASDDSWTTLSDQPQTFDLLTLQNDATALLGGADLSPGTYGQLRLIVD